MNIIQDFIKPGMRHRPMTNPASSLYKKTMKAQYITIHNAYSTAKAKGLHEYVKSQRAADRPASWHFSIDGKDCYQALPLNESGWHAGDNLGPGNTTTIGIEICDYAMLVKPQNKELFWDACNYTARLCAYLIETVPSLKPYPECLRLRQHWHWSGKNCPSWIREEPGGWQKFVDMVGEYLKVAEETEFMDESEYRWLLISGSYTKPVNAQNQAGKLISAGYEPRIMEVLISGVKYYRVVVKEHNQKGVISLWKDTLQSKGFSADLIDQRPKPEPEEEIVIPDDDELIEGVDPDLDRDWIDEHKDEFEGKDPYEDVSGLLVLLRQIYEILKKLFGGD